MEKHIQKNRYIVGTLLVLVTILFSCSKDFLEITPKDGLVDASFFKNDNEVLAGSALLYNKVWFNYNNEASYSIGDFRGGTAFSGYSYRQSTELNMTANNTDNAAAWSSFYTVIGQSNLLIQNVKRYAGAEVTEKTKKHAIAEARFMRALAYRYLVMNWGEVPIIENNLTLIADTSISRNTIPSVWKFIIKEMRAAAADLSETSIAPGRLTSWSAEAMLARFYLNASGVGASPGGRNQVFLDSAKYYSKRVIEQGPYSLMTNYSDLFLFGYDNNKESIFSLQWVFSTKDAYGTANSTPSYLAYDKSIANGDGWGGDKSATLWMLGKYEGLLTNGKTPDVRLHETFMMPGFTYPEITQTVTVDGADTYQKLVYPQDGTTDADRNYVAIKKYVCGQVDKDMGGKGASQHYDYDTYMLRLAELYLIYAEAELGNKASTTDGTALAYFNKIHERAGLPAESILDFNKIFDERILEFAMEGMAWYDLVSLHYYDPQTAYDIISDQDRGLIFAKADKIPDPTSWTVVPTSWDSNRKHTVSESNFVLPIPDAEKAAAPNLSKPPVDYYNK